MQDKKITINDVAKLAGVSKRTVSRVINRSPLVGENTLKKVEKIIKEVNFSPDKQARGLASSRSYLLGLIYDHDDSLSIVQVQQGALSVCAQLGYELVVHPCKSKETDFIEECINSINRSKLDGVIILPPISENKQLAAALRAANCPYVRIASVDFDDKLNIVVSDERTAMKEMAEHFVDLGHKNIAFISGPLSYRSSIERMEGFLFELRSANIEIAESHILEGENSYESGMKCAMELLTKETRPTAILANNDEMATGVIRVASDLGIKIPEELSVAGFDDNIYASRIIPSLTTIKRPIENMAALASQKLINKVQSEHSAPIKLCGEVKPHLIIRESTTKKST
ncbi:LacI family DNA-binding transcriptional regulator [Colwellia sp. MB02u-18]|uniref:LacI family DNA-binding transcriptional regulator n=1 Tax=unclassified Colwellia TaxID=196834 RepID=UPI0015F42E3A|nr:MULTISPECIES: LacI family DNA-binding transcriptional regulator [unclassified Colwellia]MBA6222645.1 LacI family DNA-binding transcriptional regulator [Colwellia sp. MB3u-45]MBA6269167.1 LacI family DNA-binding transcriptional regulator [Colwellia sp. MB3u-43]MBA6322778.1 LacI family DNA-binding transcriptional regulator [Colwellia sp. MB02u-19]MBA6323449.1 LacI family DNA-binding transcriptional regulator [Colwellia sp. MB02u-18]MBA6332921.1 LacI family DNA-binding transcriptional regulato